MKDLDMTGIIIGLLAAFLLILALAIVYAVISDRHFLHRERMRERVPMPESEARECKHTTDFYQGTYNDLINYGEMLAEELKQEPA